MTILGNSKHALDQQLEDCSSKRPQKIVKVNEEEFDEDELEVGIELKQEKESICAEMKMNPNPRVQRYLVAVEYIGTRFAGAQQQSSVRTVVGVLQDAFEKFIGQPVSIFCSSRTKYDSNNIGKDDDITISIGVMNSISECVHALSNVCHVDVERISKRKPGELLPPHEPSVVKRAVNHFLQKNEGDITIIDARCVPFDFHARYRAQERTYYYRLLSGPDPLSTFEKDRAWHVTDELDLVAMQHACKILSGHHDFSSFRAAACQAKSPVRTLDVLNVTEVASQLSFPAIQENTAQCDYLDNQSRVSSTESETKLHEKTDGLNMQPSALFT